MSQDQRLDRFYRPVVLIVRDGWGANPFPEWNHANAVYLATKPVDDRLMTEFPHVLIKTSGRDVGLPEGTMGNSEVGHQNIGAGRVVDQEIMRITRRIEDGSFFTLPAFVGAFNRARTAGGCVHILGLCSDGRVHSDLDHLYALMEMPRRVGFPSERVFIHAITDGRDTPPFKGLEFLDAIATRAGALGLPPIASVLGRYYAMDRDHRWDRVKLAYDCLTGRNIPSERTFPSARAAIEHYYKHPSSETMKGDEFILPAATLGDPSRGRLQNGDSLLFYNFRGDRPRELVRAITFDEFPYDGRGKDGKPARMGFDRGAKLDLYFATMTGYEKELPVHVAFEKPAPLADILGAYLSRLGKRQFRCAETEKYPHVTFFFNDYRDEPFPGEERILVHSPREVKTYDEKPEMSAVEVTDRMTEAIRSGRFDAMILNYANGDMVGHTGNLPAAIRAVETVDACVGRVVAETVKMGGALIITADHGNCEQMIDPATGGPHTAHTVYPVDLIIVGTGLTGWKLREGGRLADIAPTALKLMGLPKPEAMTGESLI